MAKDLKRSHVADAAKAAKGYEAEPLRSRDLFLDPANPRLIDSHFAVTQQDEILKRLWKEFNVSEIVDSIVASNEYWKHEPLIACRENDRLVVVEGNRRLAAVQLLLSPERQAKIGATGVPQISKDLAASLDFLPAIVKPRKDVWEFVGFKHVNGPQEWDSIAKAEYIARVHEKYEVPIADIAKTIGDRNDTVLRLYHGLKVLEQARKAGVFDPDDRFYQKKRFAYSHLWTGLGYDGIRRYLGLTDASRWRREPVPKNKITALGKLCRWMYGSFEEDQEPHVKSQNPNLRELDEALRTSRGIAALESGLSLEDSVNASRGDTRLLLDALVEAEQNLRDAKGYFSTGFNGQEEIRETIDNVHTLAQSLFDELEAVESRKKKVASSTRV
jgi:hypothetical protein